jgi:hypothetical protein
VVATAAQPPVDADATAVGDAAAAVTTVTQAPDAAGAAAVVDAALAVTTVARLSADARATGGYAGAPRSRASPPGRAAEATGARAKAKSKARSRTFRGANAPRDTEVVERMLARNALARDKPEVTAARGASVRLRLEKEADAAAATNSRVGFPPLTAAHRGTGATAPSARARSTRYVRLGPPFPRYQPRDCISSKVASCETQSSK